MLVVVVLFSAGARPPAGEVAAPEPHSPNPILLTNEDTGSAIHVMALASIFAESTM